MERRGERGRGTGQGAKMGVDAALLLVDRGEVSGRRGGKAGGYGNTTIGVGKEVERKEEKRVGKGSGCGRE